MEYTIEHDNLIRENEKIFRYTPVQWDLEAIARKLSLEDSGDLFIPPYQRDYVWNKKDQSLFIESLLLNIPIPFIFLNIDEGTGETEIVDGYQRIRTIYEFLNSNFKLVGLEKLHTLNGMKYEDFSTVRKSLFKNKSLNIILFQNLDDEQKKEMFARINSTGLPLNSSEKRKGSIGGKFYEFMKNLSDNSLTKKMIPLSVGKEKREESIELILRYFAYTEKFEEYNNNQPVYKFLDDYMVAKNNEMGDPEKQEDIKNTMENDFFNMLNFVNENFKNGFRKSAKQKIISSRSYYEAIAVGVGLALQYTNNNMAVLHINKIPDLLRSKTFQEIVSSDGANSIKRFQGRILAVKNALVDGILP